MAKKKSEDKKVNKQDPKPFSVKDRIKKLKERQKALEDAMGK